MRHRQDERKPFAPRSGNQISPEAYATPGNWFFLTTRALYGKRPFETAARCEVVIEQIRAQSLACHCQVGPYCLMPDHLHLLITPSADGPGVKAFVRRLHGAATNKLWPTGWKGRVWQAGSYDVLLEDEDAARETATYLWMNPVRAGLADSPEAWPWSGCMDDLGLFTWPS